MKFFTILLTLCLTLSVLLPLQAASLAYYPDDMRGLPQAAAGATATPAVIAAPTPQPTPEPQAAALLPAMRADMQRAAEWNRYSIQATLDPARRRVDGNLTLSYTNRDSVALDRLYFHLFPNLQDLAGKLTITAVTIGEQTRPVVYEQARQLLRISLAQPLARGATAEIQLSFTTIVPSNVGASKYGAFNIQNKVMSLASCYPIVARVRDGKWDIGALDTRGDLVNSETALYDLTLTAPADWTLVSTGTTIARRLNQGQQTVKIVSGPQRDMLIVAHQLKTLSADVDGIRVTSAYRAGEEQAGKFALDVAVQALGLYNKRFGDYPLTEFDMLPIDASYFLGVEYPGMTLIAHELYKPGSRELEITIAHEVAHQWWYSIIGNDVQREAWLDEALASYSQVLYAESYLGADAAEEELNLFRGSYRKLREAGRDVPIAQANTKIRNYFTIVYAKGALFFHALRGKIGDPAFSRFLQGYYATHRYDIVTGTDLLAAAEAGCGCQLDDFYRDWITTAAAVPIP